MKFLILFLIAFSAYAAEAVYSESDVGAETTQAQIDEYVARRWDILAGGDYAQSYDVDCAAPYFKQALTAQLRAHQLEVMAAIPTAKNDEPVLTPHQQELQNLMRVQQNESSRNYGIIQSQCARSEEIAVHKQPVNVPDTTPVYEPAPQPVYSPQPVPMPTQNFVGTYMKVDPYGQQWTISDAACQDPQLVADGYRYLIYSGTEIGCWNDRQKIAYTVRQINGRQTNNIGMVRQDMFVDNTWIRIR